MWLLYVLGRTVRGAWRLFIGLIIGVVLYVYMFWFHKDSWQAIQDGGAHLMRELLSTPWFSDYLQWNTLLHLDEKLIFAMYVLVGRLIWMLLEGLFFTFPHWLFKGRHEQREIEAARELLRQQREVELRSAENGMAALKSQLSSGGGDKEHHSLVEAIDQLKKPH